MKRTVITMDGNGELSIPSNLKDLWMSEGELVDMLHVTAPKPFGWSACARYTGIRSPPSGHRQPLCWATTAHNAGNECPNIGLIFGQYSFDSLRYLKRSNWLFACFVLSLMILL